MAEVQELDSMIGNLDTSETPEYAPLLLGWATFLFLVSFLPAQGGQPPIQVCNHYFNSIVGLGQSEALIPSFSNLDHGSDYGGL